MKLRLRLARLALLALMLLYVPMLIGIVAGLVWVAVKFTMWTMGLSTIGADFGGALIIVALGFDLSVLCCCLLLLLALLPIIYRDVSKPPEPGFLLDPSDHPKLSKLLDRICKRIGVRPPDECYLSPFEEASIGDHTYRDEDGRLCRGRRQLVIGAGLVIHSNVAEIASVLCHEIAHAAAGDTRRTRWTTQFWESMCLALGMYDEEEEEHGWLVFFTRLVLLAYFYVFAVLYVYDRRSRELDADRVAASICGPRQARNMLTNSHANGYLEGLSVVSIVEEFCGHEMPLENVYAEARRRHAALTPAMLEKAQNKAFMEPLKFWDTHPTLAVRFREVSRVEAPELKAPQPATTLFADWPTLEGRITQVMMRFGESLHKAELAELDQRIRDVMA